MEKYPDQIIHEIALSETQKNGGVDRDHLLELSSSALRGPDAKHVANYTINWLMHEGLIETLHSGALAGVELTSSVGEL